MKKSLGFWFTTLTVVLLTALTSAPALPQEEVSDEELMELLGMTVEAASKREESVMTAPAVVSVLTAQDIKELGIHRVSDAVGYITGIHLNPHYLGETQLFALRGSYKDFSADVLFLVNGHPIFSAVQGMFDVNYIPIEAVERIEVIRGPVSVIYGTNAMSGVINIVTWKEPTFLNGQIRYQYGSFGTHELRASFGKNYDKFRYFVSGTYRTQDGYDYIVKPEQDMLGIGYQHVQYDKLRSLFLSMAYENLEIDFSYNKILTRSMQGMLPNSLYYSGSWEMPTLYADVRYKKEIVKDTTFNLKFRADSHEDMFSPDSEVPLGEAKSLGTKMGVEMFLDTNISEKSKMMIGVSYDRYHSDAFETILFAKIPIYSMTFTCPDSSTSDTAVFANFNYQAADPVNLLAGVRYTNNSVTGSHTDYHLGSVFNLSNDLVLKLLYGTSYRSPNHFELYIYGFPVIMGKADLKFETMQGVDIALVYNYKNILLASGGYFFNRSDDYIGVRPIGYIAYYSNIKGHETQGLEFELKYRPSKQFSFFMNATSILSGKDLALDADLPIVKNLFNFGLSFKPIDQLLVSSSNYYRGSWAAADSYFMSNIALYYTISERQPGAELVLTVNNLFDKEYNLYSFVNPFAADPTLLGGPGRSVTAGIILSF
jgi:outer membrane receptor for ferrienterochelin and colicins